jgi:hypothetical protein
MNTNQQVEEKKKKKKLKNPHENHTNMKLRMELVFAPIIVQK